jgi:class 3 adenylate cyclase/tetratricopeptide (TPR) repeat protein
MNCPNCKFANSEDARFCQNCGYALTVACPNCGVVNATPARFCKSCGAGLQAEAGATSPAEARPRDEQAGGRDALLRFIPRELAAKLEAARTSRTMEGERRIVTMLFCDVKGSTAAAGRLDPEEWTEVINGAFEHMIPPVYRYEGTVARLMGDGILAFFGAPIAHEDDPQRAVLAGLEIVANMAAYSMKIQSQWGLDLEVRVGINTGLVVVGAVGSDLRMEYTALGDAINLAARMEQTAEPGTVRLAENTHRLVEHFFELEPLGPIEVKGKDRPVLAFRALRARVHPERTRSLSGLMAPLVGRERELAELRTILRGLRASVGHIVLVIGEAGLGKSRLTEELHADWEREMASTGEEGRWLEFSSASYHAAKPYSQVIDLVGRAAGLMGDESPEAIREALRALAERLRLADHEKAIEVLEVLLGIQSEGSAPEGEMYRAELFAVISEMLANWAAQGPAVFLFDDLHWADRASVELLQHAFQLADHTPLLFICLMRPERQAPAWGLRSALEESLSHRTTEIWLRPLSESDSLALVDQLLDIDDLPESIRQQVIHRAEGNPLFVEEVVRSLIDTGALVREGEGLRWAGGQDGSKLALPIPDSLQALLTARIDCLDDEARRALQLASVIGRRFYYRVLMMIFDSSGELDQQLGVLQRADLIREAARLPELEYLFRQALTQEAAYRTILRKQRKEFHRRVAESLERLFPNQLEKLATQLAFHYQEAGDAGRALNYHCLAGDAAYRLYALSDAIDYYRRALALARTVADAPADLLTRIYTRLGRSYELESRFEQAFGVYAEMEREALTAGDRRLELASLALQGTLRSTSNPLRNDEEALAIAARALPLAEELEDRAAEARIHWNLVNVARFGGLTAEEGIRHGELALAIARELELKEQMAYVLNDMADLLASVGQAQRGLELLDQAGQLWRELDNTAMLADSLSSAAIFDGISGQLDRALAHAEEAYQLSKSIRNLWGQGYSRTFAGIIGWEQGRPSDTIAALEEAIELNDRAGFTIGRLMARVFLARLLADLGAQAAAFELVAQADEIGRQHVPRYAALAGALLVELYLLGGDLPRAREAAQQLPADPEVRDPFLLAYIQGAVARLALAEGRFADALRVASDFIEVVTRTGVYRSLPEARLLQAQALIGLGQPAEAQESLRTAGVEAEQMGMRRVRWQLLAEEAHASEARGRPPAEVRPLRDQARAIVSEIADRIDDPALRESYLSQGTPAELFKMKGGA